MNGYYKQVIDLLKKDGLHLTSPGKRFPRDMEKRSVAVSVPSNCASRHTANDILKDAGIKQKLYVDGSFIEARARPERAFLRLTPEAG
jgi:hypothetical protein